MSQEYIDDSHHGVPPSEPPKKSRMPKYNKLTQQELWAVRPVLSPRTVILTLLLLAAVFIPLGAVCLHYGTSAVELISRYDDICIPGKTDNSGKENLLNLANGAGTTCDVSITIPTTMKAPIYMYYRITNMYQNHRRYVQSVSESQLIDRGVTQASLDRCKPQLYLDGNTNDVIRPCGLNAWTMFNDTYDVTHASNGNTVRPRRSGIAWPADKNTRYSGAAFSNFNTLPALRGGLEKTGFLNDAEDLMVWMRTATLPNFIKLYGVIEEDLPAGTELTVRVANRYNTYRFNGTKSIVLSTTTWLGGKNPVLGIVGLITGCLSLLMAVLFFLVIRYQPRQLGDLSYLSWNQKAP